MTPFSRYRSHVEPSPLTCDVVDRITVTYKASEALAPVIAKNADAIASAVLATAISEGDALEGGYAKDWKINGEAATLGVRKNG